MKALGFWREKRNESTINSGWIPVNEICGDFRSSGAGGQTSINRQSCEIVFNVFESKLYSLPET